MQSVLFIWVIVPLLIFLARIVDVSLQTIRIVSISRGIRWLAPLVGFFEVLIWLLAIGQIMKKVSHPVAYIAYAAGFAAGTAIGQSIERRLSLGTVLVRVITPSSSQEFRRRLRELKFGFTHVPARGAEGPVEIVFTVIRRQHLRQVQRPGERGRARRLLLGRRGGRRARNRLPGAAAARSATRSALSPVLQAQVARPRRRQKSTSPLAGRADWPEIAGAAHGFSSMVTWTMPPRSRSRAL